MKDQPLRRKWRKRNRPLLRLRRRDEVSGKVEIYTEIIPNCQAVTLHKIIQRKLNLEETILLSDGWKGYPGLVDLWLDHHYRVDLWDNAFSKWNWIHINSIANFWSFTKKDLINLTEWKWISDFILKSTNGDSKNKLLKLNKNFLQWYVISTENNFLLV